ncbi:hypothetical protein [Streptomyces sp. NPDC001970]
MDVHVSALLYRPAAGRDVGRVLATGEAFNRPAHHKTATTPRRTADVSRDRGPHGLLVVRLDLYVDLQRGLPMGHGAERKNGNGSASEAYTRDIRADRQSVREALRSDLPAAHIGLGVTVIALVVVAGFAGARWTLIVGGAFPAWFVLALAVIRIGSGRGWDAVRRAYIATFGWGNWI